VTRLVFSAALLILASFANAAVRYVPADDSIPLLRRDLIPMDVDAIRDLADYLAILADGPMPKSAVKVRHRAQLLTLSQRLLPGHERARSIETSYLKGGERRPPEAFFVKSARKTIIETADWLGQLPKEADGHLLGQLLLDVLAPIASDHPVLKNHDALNTDKRWSGVIAKLSKFDLQKQLAVNQDPKIKPAQNQTTSNYKVKAILAETLMFSNGIDDGASSKPGLVTTSLIITDAPTPDPDDKETPGSADQQGALKFQPPTDFNVNPLHASLLSFFRKNAKALPNGYNLNINTNKRQYLTKNRENIAANIAMMLDAAVSGRPLRRNTILFARLQATGNLEKPHYAWELLQRLEELSLPTGTRLIVGKGLIEEMTGMLVLDKASFFTKYEILEVSNFEMARELFYEDGKLPKDLQTATKSYLEVRDKAMQVTNLGTFLSLSAVKDRLIKASQLAPNHISTVMLARQSVRRPAYFSRSLFAQELHRLLEPLAQFKYKIDQTTELAVKDAYKKTRDRITLLEKRLQRRDLEILDDALNLIQDLNSLGRGASAILDNEEETRAQDMIKFQKKLEDFRARLREIFQPVPKKDK